MRDEAWERATIASEIHARRWPGDMWVRNKRSRHFRAGFMEGVRWILCRMMHSALRERQAALKLQAEAEGRG